MSPPILFILISGDGAKLKIPADVLGRLVLLGVFTGAAMIPGWAGLARLDASLSALLWRFMPVLTILLGAMLLRERLSAREWLPLGLMLAGGCLSSLGQWRIVAAGVILTLLACLMMSLQLLLARNLGEKVEAETLAFYRNAFGLVTLAVLVPLTGSIQITARPVYWIITILGAVVAPGLGILLIFRSYCYWSLSRASIVQTSEPLFVLPLAYLFLGQWPRGLDLAGGLLILTGAFWIAWMYAVPRHNP